MDIPLPTSIMIPVSAAEALSSPAALYTGLILAASWFVVRLYNVGQRESYLPPGPPTLPLLGNLHLFPNRDIHLKFFEWFHEYGKIYSLKMGPSGTAVVLTDPTAVYEILDKQSSITADRPKNHIADRVTGCLNMTLAHYTDIWKSLRRGAHEVLSPKACLSHIAIQQAEATQLCYDFLTKPDDFVNGIHRYTHSVILSVLYGKRVPRITSLNANAFFDMMHRWVNLLAPGAHPPVDMVPILQQVPKKFAKWKRICDDVRKAQRKLYFGLLGEVEARIKMGLTNGCFMETIVERAEIMLDSYLGGVMIEGGSDTTSAFLQSLVLLLMANPDVQMKARNEIDAIVGPDRMPTLEDVKNMPYVQSVILETHRSRPVTPVNFPHVALENIKYGDFIIPKGTSIFTNAWGIYHDSELFPEPDRFYPDRFMGPKGDDGVKIMSIAFGNGRRSCPGIHLAKNATFLTTANLLWGFNFGKTLDASGKEIEPDTLDYAVGISFSPNPYKCAITARTPQHAKTIRTQMRGYSDTFMAFEHDLTEEDKTYVQGIRRDLQEEIHASA